SKEPVVGVRKRPPAPDRDEPEVAVFWQDHGSTVPEYTWPIWPSACQSCWPRRPRESEVEAAGLPSGLTTASRLLPAARTVSATGDSGGMYQTIGRVRYSGCSGSATRCRAISAYTGERCAASIQSRGMPAWLAWACTAGS